MKGAYEYKAYCSARMGIFRVTADIYGPQGWESEPKKFKIIGESGNTYVTHLLPFEYGEWIGNKVIQRKRILPVGIHKSRLITWTSVQLSLF